MNTVIIISCIVCALLIALVLIKPNLEIKGHSISIYWFAPLMGALILIFAGFLGFKEVFKAMTENTSINPVKILVLFISITVISIFLDEAGFFKFLASYTLKKAKSSQKKLFMLLYIIVSVLTVFTSNDIIILTFTPFICYFAKNAKINPVPFLIAEFVAANTWSMALIIGNPTNIYLASASGINFLQYASVMIVPAIFGGLSAFIILYLLFRKKLAVPLQIGFDEEISLNKPLCITGLVHLSLCTVLLVISSYIGLEMWLITLCFCVSLLIFGIGYSIVKKRRPNEILTSIKRAPWELIPFVLSMFVIVIALNKYNVTAKIADLIGESNTVIKYGVSSFFAANLINNIPMSVFYSNIISSYEGAMLIRAVYASVIGSNLGAILTPVGALAGIMWTGILKKHNVKFSFLTFIKYGVAISIPTLFATLGGLILMTL